MKKKQILLSVFQMLLIVAVFIGIIYYSKSRPTNRVFVNKYATSDVVYADGRTEHFKSKSFGMVNKGDVVTVYLRLPEKPIMDDAVLTFYIYHSVTEVTCNGVLLDSYGADIDARGDMVGNARFFINVPDEAWGGEITITLRVTENNAFTQIKNLGLYPAKLSYQYLIDADPISFMLLFPLALIGVILLFTFLISGKYGRSNRKLLYMALFALSASLYFLTSKGVNHLFGFTGYLWSIMEFVAAYTLVVPVLLWAYDTVKKGTVFRRILGITLIVNVLFDLVAGILNFTNIAHFSVLLLASNILTFVSGVILVVFAVYRLIKGKRSDRLFFSGMCIMFITGLSDLSRLKLNLYFSKWIHITLPSLMPLGVVFFLFYLLQSLLQEIEEQRDRLTEATVQAENLNKVVASIPAGVCQFVPGEHIKIVAANDIFYKIMGYREADLQKGKVEDAFANLYDYEKKYLSEKVQEILNNPQNFGEFEFDTVDINNKPLTIIIRYFYDKEDTGNITINLVDITDRKQVEEMLRISEKRYKLALSQSGKVFFFFDIPTRTMNLSKELGEAFGLPMVVDNMPENFISRGLVEPESIENYRQFYNEIISGKESGETVISCHMRNSPDNVMWYHLTFTSIFDDLGYPMSAVITYEDINESYEVELASRWKDMSLNAAYGERHSIVSFDLNRDRLLSQSGLIYDKPLDPGISFDHILDRATAECIIEEDRDAVNALVNREKLIEMYRNGTRETRLEYRSKQHGKAYRWTELIVQITDAPYSGHIIAQLIFVDIHEQKSGEIALHHDMDKLKKELENSRIRVMINQMQPHFLYNALSAIQTIVKVDPDYAYQLIYDFTVHLRASIKALASDEPISFESELTNIKAYLNIEKMRFGDRMNVVYDIGCQDFSVIPLSIQPLAENAARHGLYPKGKAGGTIRIRTSETPEYNIVEVEDDGVGFDVNEILNKDSDSIGLVNLIFRMKSLMNADVSIKSAPGEGTLVRVTIPKKQEGGESRENDNR